MSRAGICPTPPPGDKFINPSLGLVPCRHKVPVPDASRNAFGRPFKVPGRARSQEALFPACLQARGRKDFAGTLCLRGTRLLQGVQGLHPGTRIIKFNKLKIVDMYQKLVGHHKQTCFVFFTSSRIVYVCLKHNVNHKLSESRTLPERTCCGRQNK